MAGMKLFFQQILIEDKTALILLLHPKSYFAIQIHHPTPTSPIKIIILFNALP